MKFRYENYRSLGARLILQLGKFDIWYVDTDVIGARERIHCADTSGGSRYAPLKGERIEGQLVSFEAFLERYHGIPSRKGVREALRAGRDFILDPSISPNARMVGNG